MKGQNNCNASKTKIKKFQEKLLGWYRRNKRSLPWRMTNNSYHILVSEIMLQQTQVERVIPKYEAFIREFPTVKDVSNAPREKLIRMWSGLGYNRRVVNLQKCCQRVVEEWNGTIPKDYEELLSLPGIGPYTAAAIGAFAFNQEEPCIDTNVRRVLIHEFKLPNTIASSELIEIARKCIPKRKSREWHSALMDYGSAVVTTKATGIKPLTKQSKFVGSRRWYRGQLLKNLQEKSVTIAALQKKWKREREWVIRIVDHLEKDGLVVRVGEQVVLP